MTDDSSSGDRWEHPHDPAVTGPLRPRPDIPATAGPAPEPAPEEGAPAVGAAPPAVPPVTTADTGTTHQEPGGRVATARGAGPSWLVRSGWRFVALGTAAALLLLVVGGAGGFALGRATGDEARLSRAGFASGSGGEGDRRGAGGFGGHRPGEQGGFGPPGSLR